MSGNGQVGKVVTILRSPFLTLLLLSYCCYKIFKINLIFNEYLNNVSEDNLAVTIQWRKNMAVIAANITDDTSELIDQVLTSREFEQFTSQTKLNLSDKTILIRLALINLTKNIPSIDEVLKYKSALLRPHEFDDFWRQKLGVENTVT